MRDVCIVFAIFTAYLGRYKLSSGTSHHSSLSSYPSCIVCSQTDNNSKRMNRVIAPPRVRTLNLEHRLALINMHLAIVGDGADGVLLAPGVGRPDGGAVVGAIFGTRLVESTCRYEARYSRRNKVVRAGGGSTRGVWKDSMKI